MEPTLMSGFCKKSWKLELLSVGRLVIIAIVRLSSILLCLQDRFLGIFLRLRGGQKQISYLPLTA